jgi:hypothetical protein
MTANTSASKKAKGNHFKHGLSKTKFYRAWLHMRERCNKPQNKNYKDYGGRGIKVCPEWENFDNFYKDMYPSYEEVLSLDRTDVNGNYEPKNCRWIPMRLQNANRRNNRVIEYKGEKKTIVEWSRHLGINRTTLRMRLDVYGYSVEEALKERVTYNHGR